jgi:predicted metal-dependent hydrolase
VRVTACLAEGAAAFNRGAFFEAHDRWEDVWRSLDGPERGWVQGLIQVAAALHKLQGAHPQGCRRLLHKGLAKLAGAPAELQGYDLARLTSDATLLLEALETGAPPGLRLVLLRHGS